MEMWNLYPSYTSMSHEQVNALKHQQVVVNIMAFIKMMLSWSCLSASFSIVFLFPMEHVGPVFDTMSFLCGWTAMYTVRIWILINTCHTHQLVSIWHAILSRNYLKGCDVKIKHWWQWHKVLGLVQYNPPVCAYKTIVDHDPFSSFFFFHFLRPSSSFSLSSFIFYHCFHSIIMESKPETEQEKIEYEIDEKKQEELYEKVTKLQSRMTSQ